MSHDTALGDKQPQKMVFLKRKKDVGYVLGLF